MNREEIFKLINANPAFHLATVEGDQPRCRGMLVYRADENGIVFHTGSMRQVYEQITRNPKVEMCFNDKSGLQIRVSGKLESIGDRAFKDEVSSHPSRTFLKPWMDAISQEEFYNSFIVYRLKNGKATLWTMAKNLAPKEEVDL